MLNDSFRTNEIASAQTSAQTPLARNLIEEQIDRLKLVTKSNTKTDLAKHFGITRQAVDYSIKKPQLPPGWFITIAEKYNLSLNWLVYGEGPMKRGEDVGLTRKEGVTRDAPRTEDLKTEVAARENPFVQAVGDLKEIFDSNDQVIITAIQANLFTFRRAAQDRREIARLKIENQEFHAKINIVEDKNKELETRLAALEAKLSRDAQAPPSAIAG